MCCGEGNVEFLTLDHIEGNGHAERLANPRRGVQFYGWLIRQGYPKGYRILCFNCNCARGIHGYCPHERQKEGLKLA